VSLLVRAPVAEVAFPCSSVSDVPHGMTARGRKPHFWDMTSHLSSVSPQRSSRCPQVKRLSGAEGRDVAGWEPLANPRRTG
jgi:hypothetical protein